MNPEPSSNHPRPRRSGIVVPHTADWRGKTGALVLSSILRFLGRTIRWDGPGAAAVVDSTTGKNAIYCIWHNRLALALMIHDRFIRTRDPERRLAALVSASKDGGFLAETLRRFDVEPARGSSSRRGAQAMLELASLAEQGYNLAITPDGPRGPVYVVQEGAVALAQITGLPIIAVSANLSSKIRLKSWDRFQIPLPFSRCEVRIAEPIFVARDIPDEARMKICIEVQQRLMGMTRD